MDDSAKVSSLLSAGTTKKYDIPLGYLDFTYIEKCEDLKILEKIYKILKSGDEGFYPQLETCCEDKIRKLNPNSRILRKDNPLKTKRELETEEREELDEDLKSWSSDMKFMDSHLQTPATIATDDMDEDLPPIRSGNITLTANGVKETKGSQKSSKRVMPREYKDWDKIDVDKELEKVDEVDQTGKERTFIASKEVKNTSIPNTVDAKGLTENEKLMKANREKDKGNEAFRSNDFKEAITYYSRSISLQATAASYNNRALAYLKSSEWQSAVADTNIVLKMEQDNVKALLRRGTAYKGLKQYDKARQDLFTVIKKEPNNKKAQELLGEIDKIIKKEKEERKKKGRRMVIEDVDTIEEKTKEEETVEESDVAPKSIETDIDCKGGQSQKKQSRRMQIQEVESDEEEENDTDQNVVNGHATVTELKAQNEKEVVMNGHLESEVQNTVKQDIDMVKNDNKETNVSDQNTENISKQSFKIEQKEEKTNEIKETQIKEEEIKEDEKGDDDDVQNEKEEGSDEEKSDEKESDKEEESIDEKVEETVELKRPVFYMRELPSSCVKLREEANVSFRAGQYGEAREKYTKVINALEKEKDQVVNLSLMYSNRAACQLKIGDLPGCVRDCTHSLHLIPHSVKPLLRRATAYEHLERYRLAYIDNRHVLLLDNRVDQAHLGTKRCQQILHQKDGQGWREKFQLPQVSHWEIPEIIGYDGKSTAPVVFTNPAPNSQSQTSCSVNSQSQKDSSAAVKSEPANTVNKAKKQSEEKKLSPQQMFDDLKSKGNDHVKKSDFRAAIPFYSQCVDILPDQCVSYTNRALCYIRVKQPADAEEDCTKALSIEKDNVKALFRRAQARKMLKRYREGVEDLNHLLKIDTKNSAAKKELELMKNYWREELQNMKNMPKPETKPPPPPASAAHGKGDKPRKRMVIEEVDSEEETIPANKGKPASKSNAKHKPVKIQETKPKIEEVNKEPVSHKPESKPDKVKTETKDSKSSKPVNKKTQIRETSSGLPQVPRTVPKLEKATPYEFISIWNSLKKSDNVKPYYELLKQINPSDIKTVISNKIDGPMLNNITRCVAEHYIPNGELEESFQILKNLSEVPRFGTVSMFMTEGEKSEVKSVMLKLKKHTSSLYSPSDVENLEKQYGV